MTRIFGKKYFNSSRFPLIIALVMLILSGVFWINIVNYKQNDLREINEDVRTHAIIEIENHLSEHINLIDSIMLSDWNSTNNSSDLVSEDRFYDIVPYYFNFYGSYQAINWINNEGVIDWVYPEESNQGAIDVNITYTADGSLNQAFINARSTLQTTISPIIEFYQGGVGLASYIPIVYENNLYGFFNVVFKIAPIIENFIKDNPVIENFSFLFIENENIFYQYQEKFEENDNYIVSGTIEFYNKIFEYYQRPLQSKIRSVSLLAHSYIPLSGIIVAVMSILLSRYLVTKNRMQREKFRQEQEYEKLITQMEKMSALGTMAGGIAHSFNNLLMGISGNLAIMKEIFNNELEIYHQGIVDSIRSLDTIVDRAKELTQQILVFSRQSQINIEYLNVNELLEETINIFKVALDKRIIIETEFSEEVLIVEADKSRLNQAILNILNNAKQAMTGEGGTIKIKTRIVSSVVDTVPSTVNGDLVLIQISDDGVGIPEEIQNKIFDPFFTTKKVGEGTGLGLSMTYQYINSLEGSIKIDSELGLGTTVDIFLPLSEKKKQEKLDLSGLTLQEIKQEVKEILKQNFNDSTQILIIEDNENIRTILERLLDGLNAELLSTGNGKKGIAKFRSNDPIAVVILDINLPGMNGVDIYKNMIDIEPDQKTLFITGYAEKKIPVSMNHNVDILFKPFSQKELFTKLLGILRG